mgnify:CR=1 FL=1
MTANQAVEITAYRFESHYDRTFPHTILRNAALPGGLSPLSIAKNMRLILIPLLIAFTAVVSAEEDQRTGAPKDCYLYSWGKGPNWTAEISTEFRLSLLNRQMPYVDDQYSEPTESPHCSRHPKRTWRSERRPRWHSFCMDQLTIIVF